MGHARKIQQQVKDVAWAAPHDGGGNARTMALREVAVTAHEDALTLPADLLADETASLLLIKVGMLVQVQTKRADGWWFGFALESARADADADGVFGEESGASLPEAATVDEMIAALARFSGVKYVDRGYFGGGASRAEIARAAAERLGVPPNASETYVASRAHVAELYRALREWRATDEEECGAGWFPASHVGEPTPNQIQRITDLLSRRENGVISGAASDALAVLAPPPTWAAVDARTDQGPVAYVEVDPRSKEYADAITAFKATLPDARATVSKLERVQNPGMWQAYRVRRHALLCREDDRALAGRNMCMYGKGVYFARDAEYSSNPRYARPDERGDQRMLLCRVLVGAFCNGEKDALVPAERDAGGILFDTTVNKVANPSIYVTNHDAQAYPEYQITFRVT